MVKYFQNILSIISQSQRKMSKANIIYIVSKEYALRGRLQYFTSTWHDKSFQEWFAFSSSHLNIEKPNICKLHLTLLQSTVVSNPREKFLFRYWNQNLHLSVWPSWKLSKTSILKYSVNILGKYWYHCKHIELYKPIGQAGALRYNENTH